MALFIRSEYNPPGEKLLGINGGKVLDVCGNPVVSEFGKGWRNLKNANQFRCALGAIHVGCGLTGDYVDACAACRALPEERSHQGCLAHSGNPEKRRRGNPTKA